MMIYPKVWLALIFFFLFSIFACDDQEQDLNLVLPPQKQSLIIECYLEPGEHFRALVSKTMDFLESEETELRDSIQVAIIFDGKEKELLNTRVTDTLSGKFYNYWLPEKVEYQEGKEYQLKVTYGDNVSVVGKTHFMPKAGIRDIYAEYQHEPDSLGAVFIEIEDSPEANDYYRVIIRGLDPAAGFSYEGLWEDDNASEGILTAYSGFTFREGEIIVVNVYRLEEQYFNFLKSLEQARESNYNPFMQPASIQSSLEGGSGIFTAITLTSDTVKVERR